MFICPPLSPQSPTLSVIPELSQVVVYEANLRAFGHGHNLQSLTRRLGEIHDLGANVVWLMPVQPVGQIRSVGGLGSPYSLRDYETVNPEFGNEDDLRSLVQKAHRLHMGVILDWVADHTAWDHPWIKNHPDWYLTTPVGKITSPPDTNWNDVAGLDYRSTKMRTEMVREMRLWLGKYDLDGFRCDAADRIPISFWTSAIATLRTSYPKRLLMLSEGHRAQDYEAGFDLTYGWDFSNRLREIFGGKNATDLAPAVAAENKGLRAGARRLDFITNHDVAAFDSTLPEMYKSVQGERSAFAIEALYSGNPLIYSSQEMAYDKRLPIFAETSLDWNSDPRTSEWISEVDQIRSSNPACLTGSLSDLSTQDAVVFLRTRGENNVLVVANVRNHAIDVPIQTRLQGKWQMAQVGQTILLEPYQCRIFVRGGKSS